MVPGYDQNRPFEIFNVVSAQILRSLKQFALFGWMLQNDVDDSRSHAICFGKKVLGVRLSQCLSQGQHQLLTRAGLGNKLYFPVQEYPDSEIASLVRAASEMTGQPTLALLEDFGQFIVPSLLRMYGHLLKPGWKSIDVIEHTEGTVHTVVRVQNPGAKPPQLMSQRLSNNEVLMIYDSPRRMCALAIGIAKGLALHYGEHIVIREAICMHRGANRCEILFRTIA